MNIDEEKQHKFTKYTYHQDEIQAIESDHSTITLT